MRLQSLLQLCQKTSHLLEVVDDLHLGVVEGTLAQLFAGSFEGVAAVACEEMNAAQEVDVVGRIAAGAAAVLGGTDAVELCLPEAQHRRRHVEHRGHLADRVVELIFHSVFF